MIGLVSLFLSKESNFPYHMSYFYMLGYEFQNHELVPLIFSFPFEEKKKKREKKTKTIKKRKKRKKKRINLNKRPIKLISFHLWEYFKWGWSFSALEVSFVKCWLLHSCNAPNPRRVKTVTIKNFRNKRTEFLL